MSVLMKPPQPTAWRSVVRRPALWQTTPAASTEIKLNGQKLEIVMGFKYLGSVVSYEGCKPEILSRTAQTTAALTRLKPVWNDRNIPLSS